MTSPAAQNASEDRPPTARPRIRTIALLATNALPGALGGAHVANLVFFLNPDLPFAPLPVLKVVLRYATLGGLTSCALLSAITWKRRPLAWRILPWLITLVLAGIASMDWYYASHYSFFLPPGINARMIKAAIWLTLCSLIGFYTALLHTLHHRPYGARSRWGLLLLALASVYVMLERREAFKPKHRPAPRPSATEIRQRPSLLVVGVHGGSLDVVLPLARQGRLPFLARMLEQGVYGRPRSVAPILSEALWTTVATAKLPYKHGIVAERAFDAGFVADGAWILLPPTPSRLTYALWRSTHASVAIDIGFRRARAIWDVLDRLRFRTGVIGWPVLDPVGTSGAYQFSERYFLDDFQASTATPRELAERGVLFKVDPEEIDPALLEEFGDRVPLALLRELSQDLWRESLTLFLLEQRRDARAVFVLLPGLAEVSRRNFGGFSAVHFSGLRRLHFVEAERRLTAYYRHLDRFLATLWDKQPGPKILALVSTHGFEAPEGWSKIKAVLTAKTSEGVRQEEPDGLLMMTGEGLRAGFQIEDLDTVDIVPTLLYALGFPTARDLDGQVLTTAFASSFLAQNPFTVVPSYETLVPPDSETAPEASPTP